MARQRRATQTRFRHELRGIEELRTRAAELLRTVRRTRRPVILTEGGKAQGVLIDIKSYATLRETELLLEMVALGRRAEDEPAASARRRRR